MLLGVVLVLGGIVSAKIDSPRFQSYLGDKVVSYLSKKLRTEVKLGDVNFRLFDHLILHDLLIRDLNQDTLFSAKTVDVTLGLIDLLQNRYVIKKIAVEESTIFLHKEKSGDGFNFQFISDAFSGDGSNSTGTSSTKLDLNELILRQVHFTLLDEPNHTKLDFMLPETRVHVQELDLANSIIKLRDVAFIQPDLRVEKLIQEVFATTDSIISNEDIVDTAIVHINTKPIKLYVSRFRFVNALFQFDDLNAAPVTGRFDGLHQSYKNLNLEFKNGSLVMDTIKASISNISFTEKSGFILNHMEAEVSVTPTAAVAAQLKIETPYSTVSNHYAMNYLNFHSFFDYNSLVAMDIRMREASIAVADVAYFLPPANTLSGTIVASGNFTGTLDNLKGKAVSLQTAALTRFKGDIDLKGLPDTDATFVDLKVDQLVTNVSDVQQLIHQLKLPQEFSSLGTVDFKGSFTGFFNDFVAYGSLNTKIGQISSDLNMKFNEKYENASYSGNLSMRQFDIGTYSGLDSLIGTISFDTKISGSGLVLDKLDAMMNGEVQQFTFNGYNYQHLLVDGSFKKKMFTGKIKLNDENLNLDFTGLVDLSQDIPVYNFHATIEEAKLHQLKFTDSLYILSTQLDLNMRGDNIDNFIGYAIAINTTFTRPDQSLMLDTVFLNINEISGKKHFVLASGLGTATFAGNIALTKLPASFLSFLDYYFPSLPVEQELFPAIQDFDFEIVLHDVSPVLDFFLPAWKGLNHSILHGHFNSIKHAITFTGTIPSFSYRSMLVDTLDIEATTINERLHFSVISSYLSAGDSMIILHPAIKAAIAGDSAAVDLSAANFNGNSYLNLKTLFTGDSAGFMVKVLPSDLVLNSNRWNVSEDNFITYADQRLRFNNFTISHDDQSLSVSNVNLRPRATNLHFDFNKLPIADLLQLLKVDDFNIAGNLSGSMELLNVFNAPRLQANTLLSDLIINEVSVAEAVVNVNFIPEDDQISAQMLVTDASFDIRATGSYFPRKTEDPLNFDFDIRKFDLRFFETLLPGFFSGTNGTTSGHLHLAGTPDAPLLTGEMLIPNLTLKVEYLQTTYKLNNQTITFNENHIDIGKLKLQDENNGVATARGEIRHDHLRDFRFNVAVTTDRFQVLNTTEKDNSLFYGAAEAAGILQFLGPLNDLEIRASLTSMQGTDMSIPINSGNSIGDRSFIRYVVRGNDSLQRVAGLSDILPGLRLNFDLEVTPAAKIKIIFDQKAGDIISGTGNGNIRMEIDTKGDFNMYGTYTIEEGDYLFTLQNFFNKFFTIDEGGTISWTGDPYEAQIAIDAIYSTKSSVYDLAIGSGVTFSDQEIKELQRHIPVRVALKLRGSLLFPDVAFDISLPDETSLSSAAYQQIQKVKQDESELNKQVFGLLLLNRFLPTNSGTGNQSIGSDVNNSVSEFLLNQLSYWTSQIRSDIDFNFNYQSYEAKLNSSNPNDLTKRNELEVALTKRFFNDRLALEAGGNFDFAGANTNTPTGEGSTNIAGDFALDYKITPDGRLSGKAFSKSQYDVVDERYKTKNGIALSYKREFNKLKELFEKDLERQREKDERKLLKEQNKQQEIIDADTIPKPITSN